MIDNVCSGDWLYQQLQTMTPSGLHDDGSGNSGVLLLDCRSPDEYSESHVVGSLPVAVPSIMLRRLRNGSASVSAVIGGGESGRKAFVERRTRDVVVVYDSCGQQRDENDVSTGRDVAGVLINRLASDGCTVFYLQDGFTAFSKKFTHICTGHHHQQQQYLEDPSATLSLSNLRLSSSAPSSVSFLDGRLQHPGHRPVTQPPLSASKPGIGGLPFPVEVLPNLYLGDAENSRDLACLRRHNIRYVVNVTDNVPNSFENDPTLTYMRIPITDHWSETLTAFFTRAIDFIDDGREKGYGVLVHCLAGISRSVTVTVAYLMFSLALSLDDAYDFLRRSRPNISPNFNFMGQLAEFEQTLQHARQYCTCITTESVNDRRSLCCRCRQQVKTYFSTPTSLSNGEDAGVSSSSSPFSASSLTSSASAQSLTSAADPTK